MPKRMKIVFSFRCFNLDEEPLHPGGHTAESVFRKKKLRDIFNEKSQILKPQKPWQ